MNNLAPELLDAQIRVCEMSGLRRAGIPQLCSEAEAEMVE